MKVEFYPNVKAPTNREELRGQSSISKRDLKLLNKVYKTKPTILTRVLEIFRRLGEEGTDYYEELKEREYIKSLKGYPFGELRIPKTNREGVFRFYFVLEQEGVDQVLHIYGTEFKHQKSNADQDLLKSIHSIIQERRRGK